MPLRKGSVLLLLLLKILMLTSDVECAALRAFCRGGQPPFVSVDSADKCTGIFADIFAETVKRSGQNFTVTVSKALTTDASVTVDPETNTSQYDIAIAFTTVSPARLAEMDFTPMLYAVDYVAVVDAGLARQASSLLRVVSRPVVWFIFSIVGLWILGLAAIYFACETWMPFVLNNTRDRRGWWVEAQQTELHQDWDRSRFPRVSCMLTAVYAAAETMLTCSTSIALASPVSRLARLVTAGANIFLLALLGAVITSQLTSSVLQQSMPSLQDLQGLRIGASGSILSPFLRNAGITVISYSDVQLAAEGFYNGNPDKLAGFATTTPVAEWMRQTFDKAHQSVVSQPFSLQSNAKEVKAMPMSRAMSKDEAVRFIVAMQQLREESYVAKVINDNILPTDGDQAQDGDVPLVESLRQAVIAAAIGGWCLALGLLVVMLVVDQLSSRDINKDSKSGTTEGAADEEQLRDEWAMNGLKPTTSRKKSLDARPEEPCDQAADAPQHRQVRVETYGHGSAVVDVYSIDAEQHHNLIAGLVNAGILAPVPRASATNNPLRLDHDLAAR